VKSMKRGNLWLRVGLRIGLTVALIAAVMSVTVSSNPATPYSGTVWFDDVTWMRWTD